MISGQKSGISIKWNVVPQSGKEGVNGGHCKSPLIKIFCMKATGY